MNKQGRKELEKAVDLITEARQIIEFAANEEREKFDNLTEGLQASERGQKLEAIADHLEGLDEDIDRLIDSINEVVNDEIG